MTSKEKLALIKETWYDVDLTDEKYIDFDEEKTFSDLEKDLEVLEILKPMLKVEKGGTWWYLDTKHCFFENEEQIKKIKEWLENGKD